MLILNLKRLGWIIAFSFIFNNTLCAQQNSKPKSIIAQLKGQSSVPKDSFLDVLAAQISNETSKENIDAFVDSIGVSLENESLQVNGYGRLLFLHIHSKTNPTQAISEANNGLRIAKEINDTSLVFILNLKKGKVYEQNHAFEKAINTYLDNINYQSGPNRNFEKGQLYEAIGNLQYKANSSSFTRHFTEARKNLKQALTYYYKINPKNNLLYFNILNISNTVGLTFQAENKIDSAFYYFNQALEVNKILKNKFWGNLIKGNTAYIYIEKNQLDSAIKLLSSDVEISLQVKEWESASLAMLILADCYIKLNQPYSAKTEILSADSLIQLFQLPPNTKRKLFEASSAYYALQQNWEEAFKYQTKLINLRDSLNSLFNINEINKIQVRHNFEYQTTKNELLEERNKVLANDIKIKNIYFAAGAIFIIFSFLIFILLYRQFKIKGKLSNELKQKNRKIELYKNELEVEVRLRTKDLLATNKELDNFLYHSSHDIRSPIATILGLVEISGLDIAEKELKQLLKLVAYNATKMDIMLKKMQNLYYLDKIEHDTQPVNLASLVNAIIDEKNQLIDNSKTFIKIAIDKNIDVSTNEKLLKLIISNLVENALIFGARAEETQHKINIEAKYHKNKLKISIQDYGEGINQTYLDRIFDLYFRGSPKSIGNGLGLYLTKKAIEKLGGSIQVKSEYLKGSTFTIKV